MAVAKTGTGGMMGIQFQIQIQYSSASHLRPTNLLLSPIIPPLFLYNNNNNNNNNNNDNNFGVKPLFITKKNFNANSRDVVAAASSGSSLWDTWSPVSDKSTPSPSLSDIVWPSLGAFAAMAMLGKIDQLLEPKSMSMTIAPLGAVCAVLFITPKAPAARKYNMFMAQIGCAAIGVLAFTMLGPGWLARSASLSASLAFMIYTKSTHPPAASLPLLFIDGAKFHGLNYWYALFPGAAGCILLSILQEIVYYFKENFKF